ncbi:hypothetical protein FOCC_FOCC016563 [Frankliniella occidentalis]|uniref:Uncharacterized protein LOC113212368 n=1 Tax=Frankliniella occidentalis TaxID=133901 RepID=A0A6J1T0T2_FRAOC|nr:uncharacterized protein LOC113212368 [Frankliniella occidentalis]KAE8737970.1 hypothetical protein FOCC_FOCC016563 [Frankliniella occidentalis]
MVHKKSEYGLQFLKLSNDLRAQIWRENVRFREAQKRMHLSDHYWRYQLIDDQCDCDEDSNVPEESIRSNETSTLCKTEKFSKLFEDKGLQTIETTKVIDNQLLNEKESKVKHNPLPKVSEETAGSSESNASKTATSMQNNTFSTEHLNRNDNNGTSRGSFNTKEILDSRSTDDAVSRKAVHSHLNRSPTRNALKNYHSGEKSVPVFAAFGWNDSDKNVGGQKTYNVRAPVGQVHTSALLASGNRLKELESHLAMALKKRQQERSHHHQGPVNLSGIWMTEYQENFSKGQREPLVRNAFARPIVWRFS